MVPSTTRGGVAALDDDGISTCKSRINSNRTVGHKALFERSVTRITGNTFNVNFADTRIGRE